MKNDQSEQKEFVVFVKTKMAIQQKLVHLDLKGSPPRIRYLTQLIPLLRRLGATGLLIEYEDMFPYSGGLISVRSPNYYSEAELQQLFEVCIAERLQVIPLIQCIGHMEFVLKHLQFNELRELPTFPNALCPSNDRCMQLIKQMVEQVVSLHSKYLPLDYIHLGGDEVWHLGVCNRCTANCGERGWSNHCLYLDYVQRLAEHVGSSYGLQPIIWDDMLRSMPSSLISSFQLNKVVQPMIWHYADLENFQLSNDDFWSKYTKLFPKIWFASAFKGASEVNQVLPPIPFHSSNQLAWLAVNKQLEANSECVQGIALTGWSRFDHFMTLCELLPVSIPCLAICLQIIRKGQFDEEALREASDLLRCSDLIPCKPMDCQFYADFPGAQLFHLVLRLMECNSEYAMLKMHPRFVC